MLFLTFYVYCEPCNSLRGTYLINEPYMYAFE